MRRVRDDDAESAYTDEVYKYLDRTCPHLLGSNDPPSEIEARNILSFIHDAQSELQEADNEILSLHKAMELAKEKRSRIARCIAAPRAILSSIRRVPPEILILIFAWALPTKTYHVFDVKSVPWVLGQVCGRWRAAALSFTSLWSTFSLTKYPRRASLHPDYLIFLLNSALSRSRHKALTFHYSPHTRRYPHNHLFIQALVRHAPRWAHVTLTSVPEHLVPHFFPAKGNLLALQRLVLGRQSTGFPPPPTSSAFSFPWPQLTSIAIQDRFNTVLSVITRCTKLECLNYQLGFLAIWWDRNGAVVPRVVHTRLRMLRLDCPAILLPAVSFPSLQSLEIEGVSAEEYMGSLAIFIQTSGCSLQTLSLPLFKGISHDLYEVLKLCSEVCSLKLEIKDPGTAFQDLLKFLSQNGEHCDAEVSPVLPKLRRLHIGIRRDPGDDTLTSEQEASSYTVVDMISCRWAGNKDSGERLRSIVYCADFANDLKPSEIDRLETMKREGLKVSVSLNGEFGFLSGTSYEF
ncbi:hypothetical protein EV421DRAFT_1977502 [Armillaria borealis]|uniref:F-box domain-containing protein n=1 Tax=Armillaria borealis TaxID=47425 RepID=A0AA39K021_9AGAR|nr:hypothetical protein EV421DRAFT_1977502 [Armillaria borealis]